VSASPDSPHHSVILSLSSGAFCPVFSNRKCLPLFVTHLLWFGCAGSTSSSNLLLKLGPQLTVLRGLGLSEVFGTRGLCPPEGIETLALSLSVSQLTYPSNRSTSRRWSAALGPPASSTRNQITLSSLQITQPHPYLNQQKPLFLPIIAYTLSSTKLEIRAK
jgi:hypothetical protein